MRCELLCETTEESLLLLYPKESISPQISLKKSAESRCFTVTEPPLISLHWPPCKEKLIHLCLNFRRNSVMEAGLNLLSSSSPFISRCHPRSFLHPSCCSSSSSSSSSGTVCGFIFSSFPCSVWIFLLCLAQMWNSESFGWNIRSYVCRICVL